MASDVVLFSGPPGWVPPGAKAARDFTFRSREWRRLTCTAVRASSRGTAVDKSGNVTRFAVNTLRRTNLGVRSDRARTNGIPNSNCVANYVAGAYSGIDWTLSPAAGITMAIVARTQIGPDLFAFDIQVSGSTVAEASSFIFLNGTTTFPAVQGDKLVAEVRYGLNAGDMTNVRAFKQCTRECGTAGATIVQEVPTTSIEIDSEVRSYPYEYVMVEATAFFARHGLRITSAAGGAVAFTVRVIVPDQANGIHAIPSVILNPTTPDASLNIHPNPTLSGATQGTPGTPPTGMSNNSASTPLVLNTGPTAQVMGDDGVLRTVRYFNLTGTTDGSPQSQFIYLNALTAVPAVNADKLGWSVWIGAMHPTGGAAGNWAQFGTQVLFAREIAANGTTVLASRTSPAIGIDGTLRRKVANLTAANASCAYAVAGIQLVPAASTTFNHWFAISEPVLTKNDNNASVADVLTARAPGFKGTRGAALIEFSPGERVASYMPITIRSIASPTNMVQVVWKNTTDIVLRVTRAGVPDTDVAIDTGSLAAGLKSKLVVRWNATTISVCLNGLAIVTATTTMPFSDAAECLLGPVDGTVSGWGVYTVYPSDAKMRLLTRSKYKLVPFVQSGQSWLAGSNSQISVLENDTSFVLPAAYISRPPGEPRELMFRMPRVALDIAPGKFTQNDVRGGRDRLGGNEDLDDQVWPTPEGVMPSKAGQFITGASLFTPGEAAIRHLKTRFPANYLFLNINCAVGGIGIKGRRKTPSVPQANGHTQFDDVVTGLTAAKEVARLQGWTVQDVVWLEDPDFGGGADSVASIVAEYAGQKADSTTTIQGLFGATTNIHYFTYPAATGPTSRMNGTVRAAMELSLTASGWTVIGDMYWATWYRGVRRVYHDGLHYGARMAEMIGEEIGHIIGDTMTGVPHTLLRPVSVTRNADVYDFVFAEPIEADNTDTLLRSGRGIALNATAGGGAITVDSVTFPDAYTVRLTASTGTGVAASYSAGLLGYSGSGPDFDVSERRAINFRASEQLGTYLTGLPRFRWPMAFEGSVS